MGVTAVCRRWRCCTQSLSHASGLKVKPACHQVSALPQMFDVQAGAHLSPAPHPQPVALNLPIPNGVAWRNGALYIGTLDPGKSCRIYRLDNADRFALEKRSATLSDLKVVRGDLPTDHPHGCAVRG